MDHGLLTDHILKNVVSAINNPTKSQDGNVVGHNFNLISSVTFRHDQLEVLHACRQESKPLIVPLLTERLKVENTAEAILQE